MVCGSQIPAIDAVMVHGVGGAFNVSTGIETSNRVLVEMAHEGSSTSPRKDT